MTPEQVGLIQASWKQIVPVRDMAAALFYRRLFEIDPAMRPVVPRPLDVRGRQLMATIGTAVACLGRIAEIVPTMQELGRRHTSHGVRDKHYESVAEALLWTLEQCLGPGFTPEVREAWAAAYSTLSNVMKDTAHEPTQPATRPEAAHARAL